MKTFILVGYGDQDGYDRTDQTVKNDAHDYDAYLRANGVTMGVAESPVQVRNHGSATTEVTDGPFMSSTLPVAGFSVLEAESLEEAIEQAAQTPCAVAYGVVEVWPLTTQG